MRMVRRCACPTYGSTAVKSSLHGKDAGIVQLQHCVEVVVVAERRLPRVDAVGEWLTRDERKVAGR
jgi:hypothetical protein